MPVLSHPSVLLARDQISLIRHGKRTLLIVARGDEPGDRPPYPVGSRIPLHRDVGVRAGCVVVVTRVTDSAIGELDARDAHGLGYPDLAALRKDWPDLAARAWIMRIHRAAHHEPPRLLRRKAGYTTNPLAAVADAGEAPDVHTTAGFGRSAEKTERERVTELLDHRKTMKPYDRLAMVIGEADARGIDISRELFVVEQKLESMEQRVHRVADRTANDD